MFLYHVEKVVELTSPKEEIQRTNILLELTRNAKLFRKFFELMPQGEGSGLDADMVDGLHANEIIAKAKTTVGGGGSSHTHPYCKIKTGTYTGDGTTSQQVTGIGFRPKFVKIWVHPESLQEIEIWMFEKTDTMRADRCHKHSGVHKVNVANAIISLDDDGFTVDDNEVDDHPNQATQVYDYICFG